MSTSWARRIRWTNRHPTAGVVAGLSCGHAVLRRSEWQIPMDLMIDCDTCAADSARAPAHGQE